MQIDLCLLSNGNHVKENLIKLKRGKKKKRIWINVSRSLIKWKVEQLMYTDPDDAGTILLFNS